MIDVSNMLVVIDRIYEIPESKLLIVLHLSLSFLLALVSDELLFFLFLLLFFLFLLLVPASEFLEYFGIIVIDLFVHACL